MISWCRILERERGKERERCGAMVRLGVERDVWLIEVIGVPGS